MHAIALPALLAAISHGTGVPLHAGANSWMRAGANARGCI
jgi:hypothetical protein